MKTDCPCSCEYCRQDQRRRVTQQMVDDPTPLDVLALATAVALPVLAILGVIAAWMVQP